MVRIQYLQSDNKGHLEIKWPNQKQLENKGSNMQNLDMQS